MTMETQPTHQDEPTLSRQQLSNEEARERNNPQRSKIMENSIDVMNEGDPLDDAQFEEAKTTVIDLVLKSVGLSAADTTA